MTTDVVTLRQLNRATLQRQLLLERAAMPPADVVAHLVGLQAQIPENPYVGLWSRLQEFDPTDVESLILDRTLVRMCVMRGTLHLLRSDDCLVLRSLTQPILERQLWTHSEFAPHLAGVDLGEVTAFAGRLLGEHPLNGSQLRAAMAERFPHHHAAALAFSCRNLLPLVQVPPRGLWSRRGGVVNTTAAAWLGRDVVSEPSIDDTIVRYLGAFGPATAADAATWSGLSGMGDVLDRLRPRLRTYRDEGGREYFDVPDGVMAEADVPAPVRLLPEYDNLLLSHHDRRRFIPESTRQGLSSAPLPIRGTVLVDGMVVGGWRVDGEIPVPPRRRSKTSADPTAVMTVQTVGPLRAADRHAVEAEGRELLRFIDAAATTREVRFVAVGTGA